MSKLTIGNRLSTTQALRRQYIKGQEIAPLYVPNGDASLAAAIFNATKLAEFAGYRAVCILVDTSPRRYDVYVCGNDGTWQPGSWALGKWGKLSADDPGNIRNDGLIVLT